MVNPIMTLNDLMEECPLKHEFITDICPIFYSTFSHSQLYFILAAILTILTLDLS